MRQPYAQIPCTAIPFLWPYKRLTESTVCCLTGSCFADELAGLMTAAQFSCAVNPNGILYNPVSICRALSRTTPYTADDLFFYNGKWRSWDHHGSFAASDPQEALRRMEEASTQFRDLLKKAGVLIITESSAVVYELISKHLITANCHKVPQQQFTRRLLTPEEIHSALRDTVTAVRMFAPECSIVFTLSPAIHYPGDLLLNSRSKALLLSALYELCENEDHCLYFPAYEILTTELRDYRFYSDDMLHPSSIAAEIILERFIQSAFTEKALSGFRDGQRKIRKNRHLSLEDF